MTNKYRVNEMAKDFQKTNKEISSILSQYSQTPKSHLYTLTEEELAIVFDYITQHNQIEDMQVVFQDVYHEPKAETKKSAPQGEKQAQGERKKETNTSNHDASGKPKGDASKPVKNNKPENNPKAKTEGNFKGKQEVGGAGKPMGKTPEKDQNKSNQSTVVENKPSSRVPEKKVVDTRKGGNVNMAKYDDHLESFTDHRQNQQGGKEKFQGRNAQRQRGGKQMMPSNKKRQEEQEKLRKLQLEIAKKTPLKVMIPDEIAVGELASRMKKTGAEVVKTLMKMGVMAAMSDVIDYDTAALVAMELGCKVEKEVIVTIEERLIDVSEDKEEDLVSRAPVVVVMGHVDHGKTSLLDAIRKTDVVDGEAGGITQHIGAYQVDVKGNPVTFLDTPGHEAFTAMRARGAMITDVAILVVAADDGIMPQTIESINHAKAAEIPIIVAINKIDKPGANPDRITQQLTEHELVSEEWGGDTIVCHISAKQKIGLENLLDMVVLTAEVQELRANPNRTAHGAVIEARLDKGRGPVATLLIQKGTLKQGDVIIAGTAVGRVRAMTDARENKLETAGPSMPVEIIGMGEVPSAGDEFHVVDDERMARTLVEQRKHEGKMQLTSFASGKVTLEDLFSQIQLGELKNLNIIVKADVQGSAEAMKASLEKLSNEEVRVRVIHCAVGAISESDVMLSATSGAIIVGFNVRPDANARDSALRAKVDMRMYRVIYDAINEMESAMKGMLTPKFKEVELGSAEVREVYKITNVGIVAGCYVTEGKMIRNAQMRLVRDGIIVHDGNLNSLQRFKDSVKEVATGYECGITIEKFSDIKVGDVIEAFIMEQIEV